MERTEALEEPISPELALVDADLAVRAREALPDPPWLLPAVAEARERLQAAAAAVEERPAPEIPRRRPEPSFSRHLRATVVFGLVMVGLVTVVALALDFVPRSGKPTLAATRAGPAAPPPPKRSSSKQAAKPAKVRTAVKPRPARQAKPKPAPTRSPQRKSPKRSTPRAPAPKHAAKPKARPAVKVERVFSWRPFRRAAYYQVHLQRGATTVYEVRTSKRTVSIRLKLRPGTYHAIVRPAISTDAGIILGPAIVDTVVKV